METKPTMEQIRREETRWRILQILDKTRGSEIRELIIWRTLDDLQLVPSVVELRREMDYLAQKGLLKASQARSEFGYEWRAQLTAQGIDFVEFTTDDIPGIARPDRYWEV
jgi:hypothetical protein